MRIPLVIGLIKKVLVETNRVKIQPSKNFCRLIRDYRKTPVTRPLTYKVTIYTVKKRQGVRSEARDEALQQNSGYIMKNIKMPPYNNASTRLEKKFNGRISFD